MNRKEMEKEGWTQTDPNCNQYGKKISEGIYLFREDRLINPITKETEPFEYEIDLSEYTEAEKEDALDTFGYKTDDDITFLTGQDLSWIIAECLFELTD